MKVNFAAGLASFSLLAASAVAFADTPTAADAQCAALADAARVAALYAVSPAPMTFAAAPQLKLTEASVASAIPLDMAVGTAGSAFAAVWDTITRWDGALFLIMKGGNVFEVSSKVNQGERSTKSKYFNLGHDGALSGHLRPDLVSSIYALQLPAREGLTRGVMFYDAKGDNIFGVFAGGEGKQPTTAQLAQFGMTWNLIKGMPRACGVSKPVS